MAVQTGQNKVSFGKVMIKTQYAWICSIFFRMGKWILTRITNPLLDWENLNIHTGKPERQNGKAEREDRTDRLLVGVSEPSSLSRPSISSEPTNQNPSWLWNKPRPLGPMLWAGLESEPSEGERSAMGSCGR